ncbi:hypothetical protein LPB136_11680 [Tenacibaculum todarodis]|uniref:Uncharacterized protein n=1 Tax=Tenacibaculum todarodis TaxID=1850252 RepID=A0A1L3JLL7_9FLAO|nr:hypothetical protein [Tenacibaculum todarodis]APG65983.1 hypothetical protein LPB136_11680 [Tenacibaculum todarodis]
METWHYILIISTVVTGVIRVIIKVIDEKSILKKMDKINQIYPNSTIEESGDFIKKTKKKYYFFDSKDKKT